jgi:hypothetical protein
MSVKDVKKDALQVCGQTTAAPVDGAVSNKGMYRPEKVG